MLPFPFLPPLLFLLPTISRLLTTHVDWLAVKLVHRSCMHFRRVCQRHLLRDAVRTTGLWSGRATDRPRRFSSRSVGLFRPQPPLPVISSDGARNGADSYLRLKGSCRRCVIHPPVTRLHRVRDQQLRTVRSLRGGVPNRLHQLIVHFAIVARPPPPHCLFAANSRSRDAPCLTVRRPSPSCGKTRLTSIWFSEPRDWEQLVDKLQCCENRRPAAVGPLSSVALWPGGACVVASWVGHLPYKRTLFKDAPAAVGHSFSLVRSLAPRRLPTPFSLVMLSGVFAVSPHQTRYQQLQQVDCVNSNRTHADHVITMDDWRDCWRLIAEVSSSPQTVQSGPVQWRPRLREFPAPACDTGVRHPDRT